MTTQPHLEIQISGSAMAKPLHPFLRRSLIRAHGLLSPALREFSLALVGDRRMARLHRDFMGIDSPTDVLTFELDHDSHGRVTAGEVIVCTAQARRESKKRDVPVKNELLLYALHGMLHLCGFDDRNKRDFVAMHRKEDEILSVLGIGAVFSRMAREESRSK